MEIRGGEVIRNDTNKDAMGGTELLTLRLKEMVPEEMLSDFQIVSSRVREYDESKIRVFWAHDLPGDPESEFLRNNGWNKFHFFVFVSHWQRQAYIATYGIPWEKTFVIQNSVEPIDIDQRRAREPIQLIYFSTPHRGLNLLLPVFERLVDEGLDIYLTVISSFKLYGWEERDTSFHELFERCKSNPRISYVDTVPNEAVRVALREHHILAYPCTWPETSCLVLMESMTAGLACVHSDFAALPETAANMTAMYSFAQDPANHAQRFYYALKHTIETYWDEDQVQARASMKAYADAVYSTSKRAVEWEAFLEGALAEYPADKRKLPGALFTYRVT